MRQITVKKRQHVEREILADLFQWRNTLGQQFRQRYTARYGGSEAHICKPMSNLTRTGTVFLALDVRNEYGELVAPDGLEDHLWILSSYSPDLCGVKQGSLFEFTAVVKKYHRKDGSCDYTLTSINDVRPIMEEDRVYTAAAIV